MRTRCFVTKKNWRVVNQEGKKASEKERKVCTQKWGKKKAELLHRIEYACSAIESHWMRNTSYNVRGFHPEKSHLKSSAQASIRTKLSRKIVSCIILSWISHSNIWFRYSYGNLLPLPILLSYDTSHAYNEYAAFFLMPLLPPSFPFLPFIKKIKKRFFSSFLFIPKSAFVYFSRFF